MIKNVRHSVSMQKMGKVTKIEFLVFLFLKFISLNSQNIQRTINYLHAKFQSNRALAVFRKMFANFIKLTLSQQGLLPPFKEKFMFFLFNKIN